MKVYFFEPSKAAIAINNAVMDRYDIQKPCYDVYIGMN